MSLLGQALGMGRKYAKSRMTETVTVGVYESRTDPITGNASRVLVELRYSGIARVKYPSLAVTERQEPSQVVAAQEPYLSIPSDSPVLHEGDEMHVETSLSDARMVGTVARIGGTPQQGQTTSHRYPLKELS